MDASPKEKFDAAVKVIQTIPKNVSMRDAIRLIGSFQPSNSLMLMFYAYYKQVMLGSCDVPRPAFYDVIGKAKWDAWYKLGDMSTEDAMNGYVDELKNIIEAMPHTAMVQEFVSKLGDFYELVDENVAEEFRRIKPALHLNGNVTNRRLGAESSEGSPQKSSYDPGSTVGSSTEVQSDRDDLVPDVTTPDVIQAVCPITMNGHVLTDGGSHVEDLLMNDTAVPLVIGGRTKGVQSSDTDTDTDEFCDTIEASPEEVSFDSPPAPYVDKDYKLLDVSSSPTLTRDASTASLGFGPHQLTDRNWSSSELMALDRPVAAGATLIMCGGGQVDGDSGTKVTFTPSGTETQSRVPHCDDPRQSHTVTGSGSGGRGQGSDQILSNISDQLSVTINQLQQDMNRVMSRLGVLEALSATQHRERSLRNDRRTQIRPWWRNLASMSGKTLFFIVWPFIIHWFLSRRRRQLNH